MGLCPNQASGARGQPIGAATLLYHSLGSGCVEEPGLGDLGTFAAAGPWLGVSVCDQGHIARPVGNGAGRESPARDDEGSSHWCPPRLKGLGDDGVRGPDREGGSSGCLSRGRRERDPAMLGFGAVTGLGGCRRGECASRCRALHSSVPTQAFEPSGCISPGRSRCVSTEDEEEGGEVPQLFFRIELLAFSHRRAVPEERRRDSLDLSFHLLGRSVSCGEQNLWARS